MRLHSLAKQASLQKLCHSQRAAPAGPSTGENIVKAMMPKPPPTRLSTAAKMGPGLPDIKKPEQGKNPRAARASPEARSSMVRHRPKQNSSQRYHHDHARPMSFAVRSTEARCDQEGHDPAPPRSRPAATAARAERKGTAASVPQVPGLLGIAPLPNQSKKMDRGCATRTAGRALLIVIRLSLKCW